MLKRTTVLFLIFFICPVLITTVFSAELSSGNVSEYWMGIMSDGGRIGYTHTKITGDNDSMEVYEDSVMNITVLGTRTSLDLRSDYILGDGKINSFEYSLKSDSANLELIGVQKGDKLIMRSGGDNPKVIMLDLNRDYILPSLLPGKLASLGMNKGDEHIFYLFDPIIFYTGGDLTKLKAVVSVKGKEEVSTPSGSYDAYKVKVDAMGTSTDMWITSDGKKVKEEIPPGFVSYLSDESVKNGEDEDSFDIVKKTSIPSGKIIKNARDVREMKVEIKGIDDFSDLDINDGYRQFLSGNRLDINVNGKIGSGNGSGSGSSGDIDKYLKGSNLINTTDSKIVKKSKQITGNATDKKKKARLINDWVFENLEKVPTLSIPDSVDILESRKGDCNEHSVLFAALARAAGVPVKVVLGIVYLDGRFYYHAWDEIYAGGWLAVDPTFGQFPADATHIKLLEGDISKSTDIIRVVGKIGLNVLYYQ